MKHINDKAEIIQKLCELIIDNRKIEGINFINEKYPFVPIEKINSRQYSKVEMMKIFLRDGFIDRYSGQRLLFPGLIKLLTLEIPEIFKYHLNWKMSETHMIYWDMFPTIDHIIPIARGNNSEENWITTSQLRNSAKSNFTIEELGWEILPMGKTEEWDGLCSLFLKWISNETLVEKYKQKEDWKYIAEWAKALVMAQNSSNNFPLVKTFNQIIKPFINNKINLQQIEKAQTTITNVRNLSAGSLYKYSNSGKTYLVLSPFNYTTQKIVIAIIDSPNANPANVICSLGTEKQNNVTVIQIINDRRTPEEIIAQLPTEQKIKATKLYKGQQL